MIERPDIRSKVEDAIKRAPTSVHGANLAAALVDYNKAPTAHNYDTLANLLQAAS